MNPTLRERIRGADVPSQREKHASARTWQWQSRAVLCQYLIGRAWCLRRLAGGIPWAAAAMPYALVSRVGLEPDALHHRLRIVDPRLRRGSSG